MAWLLLGVDSLIACIAVGPIMQRRMSVLVPFALLFGVGDGLGYLLSCALHWSYPDNLGFLAPTVVAVIGVYWIAVAIVSRKAAQAEGNPKAHWGVWILPWLLSLDNITYGAVDGVSQHASIGLSAFEQFASSAIQPPSASRSASDSPTPSRRCGAACGWPTRPPAAPWWSRPASFTWSVSQFCRRKRPLSGFAFREGPTSGRATGGSHAGRAGQSGR